MPNNESSKEFIEVFAQMMYEAIAQADTGGSYFSYDGGDKSMIATFDGKFDMIVAARTLREILLSIQAELVK